MTSTPHVHTATSSCTHIQCEALAYEKDTHAERAVLRCSIRLSMALILISRKGKSLLEAANCRREHRFSVTHSNTKRQPATADGLFVKDSFQLNYTIIHILRLLSFRALWSVVLVSLWNCRVNKLYMNQSTDKHLLSSRCWWKQHQWGLTPVFFCLCFSVSAWSTLKASDLRVS